MSTTGEDIERRTRELEARDWLYRSLWWELRMERLRVGAGTVPRRAAPERRVA